MEDEISLTAAELGFVATVAGGANMLRVLEALRFPADDGAKELLVESGAASLRLRGLVPSNVQPGEVDPVALVGTLLGASTAIVRFGAFGPDAASAYFAAVGPQASAVVRIGEDGILRTTIVRGAIAIRTMVGDTVAAALDAAEVEKVSIEYSDASGDAVFGVSRADADFEFGETAGLGSSRGAGDAAAVAEAASAFLDRALLPNG
ncbi:hypothetical protein [Demequina sp. NBRC 110054]|uniref:hypothetical protein n=1 Tax=Demequina sp. NBRC 110054 TaxID=1570343 RepID=UPI001177FDFE|nr:hypothetical protein [Demequina sp. NBRC 110054]